MCFFTERLPSKNFLQKCFHQIKIPFRLNDKAYMTARNRADLCIQFPAAIRTAPIAPRCTIESAFSVSPSSSFLPPIAVHDSAFHLGNFQLLRKSNGQYRRQLPLPQPRSAPVCFAFSAPASRSARTAHLQALAAPKTGCARPIACRLQRRHRYS